MKFYSNCVEVIIDLHNNGFTNDFQLIGNDLLWVQESLVVQVGEFAVIEYYKIKETKNAKNESAVFGIIALYHNIKGILLTHHKNF